MTEPTLYGGWRRSHTMGIGALNTPQTFIVVSAALVNPLGVALGNLATLLLTLPITLTVIVLAVWQRHGMPLLSYVIGMARWRLAHTRGETTYRGHFYRCPKRWTPGAWPRPPCWFAPKSGRGR
uniref:hypothetical protein n=1 Tax=Streptomyces noursei TaxID=1971 RepID=UPI001595B335|nr:hypothetical protein [Streptomyces noursei]